MHILILRIRPKRYRGHMFSIIFFFLSLYRSYICITHVVSYVACSCFRAHLNTRREDLSVGYTSLWGLVWASLWAWDTPRLIKKKTNIYGHIGLLIFVEFNSVFHVFVSFSTIYLSKTLYIRFLFWASLANLFFGVIGLSIFD